VDFSGSVLAGMCGYLKAVVTRCVSVVSRLTHLKIPPKIPPSNLCLVGQPRVLLHDRAKTCRLIRGETEPTGLPPG